MSLSANYPAIRPSLLLDFINAPVLSPRVTFTRASSATYFDQLGVLQTAGNDVPRFDFDPSTLQPRGLLIEEQRTNLLTYSEQFDDAAWTKNRSSITANTIVAPDGTLTGDKHIPDTQNSGNHNAQRANLTVSAAQHALSVYAKQGGYSFIEIGVVDSASYTKQVRQVFDLLTGAVGNKAEVGGYTVTSASITPVGNGWYRCTLVTSTLDANSTTRVEMQGRPNNAALTAYTGDGYSGIYIWGAQLEAGAFPTSYIPTTTAAATRSEDFASMTGANFSSWYNATRGTLCTESQRLATVTTGFPRIASIRDGGINNEIQTVWGAAANKLYGVVSTGGVAQADIGYFGQSQTAIQKTALAYAANDFAFTANGQAVQADTAGTVPTVDRMLIGNGNINGHLRRIAYYPSRLTNAQLQALTAS